MILQKDFGLKYLEDFREGKIKEGLGIGFQPIDKHLRFKNGQYNIFIGLDNVGKTDFILWWFEMIALMHDKRCVLWSGENSPEQQKRKLMQMYLGQSIKDVDYKSMQKAKMVIEHHFDWVDIKETYSHHDLLDIYANSGSDIFLIDPFNGLRHDHKIPQFERNYEFSNDVRKFCNKENKTLYLNAHVISEASRTVYPVKHPLVGYSKPPIKSFIEGGQPFANRADDFYIIHRIVNHPSLMYITQLEVVKVKDTETGGTPTMKDDPICFEYNYGNGFKYKDMNICEPSTYSNPSIDLMGKVRINNQPKQEAPKEAMKPNLQFEQPTPLIRNNKDDGDLFEFEEIWD